jgi:EAL and modified HD-GYP domain-containing signal transduction protein
MKGYYIHKEPVLDTKRTLFGNELSFRKARSPQGGPKFPALSVDEDVVGAVSSGGGFERLTGNKRVFLDLGADLMQGDMFALLPKNSIFRISERDALDKEVLLKAAMLKKQGYQIAIDYSGAGWGLLPLHRAADFVRLYPSALPPDEVAPTVALFRKFPLRLIAGDVEDGEGFLRCRDLGFDLFQGPFFMTRPAEGAPPISASQAILVQLFNDLRANREIDVIEGPFKDNPKLAYGLLQLMNSAFFRVGRKVASIKQAITLLGYENLQKWVVLLLFTVDHRGAQSHPLIEKALVRSRLMESLANKTGDSALADSAFITGMLSFMHVLFDLKPDEVTQKLNVVKEIEDALVRREGSLGALLRLAESTDRQAYDRMDEELRALKLSAEDVLWAETDALMDSQSALEN